MGAAQTLRPQPGRPPAERSLRTAPESPAWQGLTSEPRTGLGPCSLSLGELHPDAGVLLLLGEESEGWGEGDAQSGARRRGQEAGPGTNPFPQWAGSASCFLPSRAGRREAATSLQCVWTLIRLACPFFRSGGSLANKARSRGVQPQLAPWRVCRTPPDRYPWQP